MKVSDYFNLSKEDKTKNLCFNDAGPLFDSKIKSFFDNCVKKQIDKIDDKLLEKWSNMLFDYVDIKDDVPIFWIRKYETSSRDSTSKQDNRRGCLTLVLEKNNNFKVKFAYAYLSNYEAQELYNMIRMGVEPPTAKEFLSLMKSGKYNIHFDENGKDCKDNDVSYFEQIPGMSIKSGIINMENWYLAHINDVNGINYKNDFNLSNEDINKIFFDKGKTKDWELLKDVCQKFNSVSSYLGHQNYSIKAKHNTLNRKVRIIYFEDLFNNFNHEFGVITTSEFSELFLNILKASFLRFVHPLNYYLVPGKNVECNCLFGKKDISIGECFDLTAVVNNYYSQKKYKTISVKLYKNIMCDAPKMTQHNENKIINISYGTAFIKSRLEEFSSVIQTFINGRELLNLSDFISEYNKKIASKINGDITITVAIEANVITDVKKPQKPLTEERICGYITKLLNDKKKALKLDKKAIIRNKLIDYIHLEEKPLGTKTYSKVAKRIIKKSSAKSLNQSINYRGIQYNKRLFVRQVLLDFIDERKPASLKDLTDIFGEKLIKLKSKVDDFSRVFKDSITLKSGEEIVISNQIGSGIKGADPFEILNILKQLDFRVD